MKLGCIKDKKLTEPDFWKNISFWRSFPKTPQNLFFSFFPSKISKKKNLLICKLYGFKSLTIMTFMIVLKQHVWEKSGSRVKCKNALGQSDFRILKLENLKNYWRYKVDFFACSFISN